MTSLEGQVAVITGASSGIGRAIAQACGEQQVTLCLIGRRLEALHEVAAELQQAGTSAYCYEVDLTSDESIHRLVDRIAQDVGQVDILVHSAGVISLGRIECTPVDVLDWHYRTNVRAPYILTQQLLPLIRARSGQIVFINSSSGLRAGAGTGLYAASKFALKALADSLRDEVNTDGVRVVSVFPGRTATPMQAAIHNVEGKLFEPAHLIQPSDIATTVVHVLGLPRTAEITDINIRPLRKPPG